MNVVKQPVYFIVLQYLALTLIFWFSFGEYQGSPTESLHDNFLSGNFYDESPQDCLVTPSLQGDYSGTPVVLPEDWINSRTSQFPLSTLVLSAILIALNSFLICRQMIRFLVLPARTYLPGIVYLTISSGIFFAGAQVSAVTAATLIILALGVLIRTFIDSDHFVRPFGGAFMLGLAMLVNTGAYLCILLIPPLIYIFRRDVRELAITIAGTVTPWFFWSYGIWVFGGSFTEPLQLLWLQITQGPGLVSLVGFETITDTVVSTVGLYISLLTIFSVVSFAAGTKDMRTRAIRVTIFMAWFFIIALAGAMFLNFEPGDMAIYAIPCAFLLPILFGRVKRTTGVVLYILMLTGVTIINLLPFIGR